MKPQSKAHAPLVSSDKPATTQFGRVPKMSGGYHHKDTEIAEFRILKKASEGAMKEINEGIKRRQRNSVVETDVPAFIPRGR